MDVISKTKNQFNFVWMQSIASWPNVLDKLIAIGGFVNAVECWSL